MISYFSYFTLFVKLHIVPAKLLRGDSHIENSVLNVDPTIFFFRWGGGGGGEGGLVGIFLRRLDLTSKFIEF